MADYGLKISKPFFDVNTVADEDLIFSSGWPSLPIAKQINVPLSSLSYVGSPSNILEYQHDLGFPPFFSVWLKGYYPTQPDKWVRVGSLYGDVSVNEQYIRVPDGYDFINPSVTDVAIQLYNIDLGVTKEYEISNAVSKPAQYDPDYGIKITKESASIDSTDLRDYVLHSRAQSPLIQARVGSIRADIGGTPGGIATYNDTKDTLAWVFGFTKQSSGYWRMTPYYSSAYPSLDIDQTSSGYTYSQFYVDSSGDTDSCLIVLRDPMFASTDIEVSY
jgi:hypothetical protein